MKRFNFNENKCRDIFEKITNKKFPNVRPDWLRNPITNRSLELDGFNEELKLAFEYNGVQHYKFTTFMHRSNDDFINQRMRDIFKISICRRRNIRLIVIPYDTSDLEKFIRCKIL